MADTELKQVSPEPSSRDVVEKEPTQGSELFQLTREIERGALFKIFHLHLAEPTILPDT